MDPFDVAEGHAGEVELGDGNVRGLDVDASRIALELVPEGTKQRK